MGKDTFNEAERFLLSNWAVSRDLELSMQEVRDKYVAVAKRVIDTVRGSHEDLDVEYVGVTQHWGKGYLALGRKAWHPTDWLTGYYIENIRLELLSDESAPLPSAYIWLKPALKKGVVFADACAAIHKAARKILSEDEMRRCELMNDGETALRLEVLPDRKSLLEMLSQADSQAFVDCLVSHFEILVKFNEVMDGALAKTRR